MLKLIILAFFRNRRPVHKSHSPTTYVPPTHKPSPAPRPRPTPPPPAQSQQPALQPSTITGNCYVIDGDTIRIGQVRLRLVGIDAPELEHPWGKKAKWQLVQMCKGQTITARVELDLANDRIVATCFLPDGRELSAEMVKLGYALDWAKFSGGKYAHLEPEEARKKHWKAAARQRGHMHVFNKL